MTGKKYWKIILLFAVSFQFFSCLHLKYSPRHTAREYSVLAKCEDIEGYLNLFKDVELDGIYTNQESGYTIISPSPEIPFVPQTCLNFIHLSDVQLCEERAYLFGGLEMEVFDALVDSLRHGRDQEKYDYAVFKSILLGIDSYAKTALKDKPSFLMHTGDSVHMSLVSELWEFLYIIDQSLKSMPWFNVIGNHDVTVLGTPISRNNVWLKNPTLAFLPISPNTQGRVCDPTNFINFHKAGPVLFSGVPILGPLKGRSGLDTISPGEFDPKGTEYQGFDMLPLQFRLKINDAEDYSEDNFPDGEKSFRTLKGYYSFDYRLKKNAATDSPMEKVRVIVLNTSEYVSFKALGGVSESQVKWARDILDGLPDKDTRVIAFGHHPLIGGQGNMRTDREHKDRLEKLQRLFEKHVDVYFCGHTHRQSFDNSCGFLQIMCPALLVFPQSGHKVKIEYGQEHMCLQIVPFSHSEMQNEGVLRQNLGHIAALWEKDGEVIEAIESIVSLGKEESYLKTQDINDILSLWENDEQIKRLVDEKIKKYGKDREIKRSLSKAVLLKHAYLGRVGAMEDDEETVYSKLGTNYKFYIPLKKLE